MNCFVYDFERCLIIISKVQDVLNFNMVRNRIIRSGFNRIEKKMGILQGGFQIVISMKIYWTVIEMNIVENTSAVDLYNKV
jgi:hypothetical protein